jgi:hypothetical protein
VNRCIAGPLLIASIMFAAVTDGAKLAANAEGLARALEGFVTMYEHQQFGEDGFDTAVKQIRDSKGALGLSDLAQFTAPQSPLAK